MRINLRRRHMLMAEQVLDGADVISILKQMRGKGMPQRVATGRFGDGAQSQTRLHCPLQPRLLHMLPSQLA